jgi:hypothetical protein
MDSLVLLIAVNAIVLIIQYNCDKVESLFEKFADGFINWSIQRSSIQDLLINLKKGLFIAQNGLFIIDFIGSLGFIRAINSGSYYFALTIFWVGICGKIGSVFVKPEHKKYYSLFVSTIKLVISIQFNSSMSVLSNSCKLVSLLVIDSLLSKVKYILLKVGFFAIVGTKEINEDSIQSIITNILTNLENQLYKINENEYELKQTITLICEQVSSKIDETLSKLKEFSQDVKNGSKYLYYLKLMGICIMIYYLDPPSTISTFLGWSLITKLFENIFEPLTIVDPMMDNAFDILNMKCSKLKSLCLKTRVGISLLSFAQRRLNKY